MENIDEVIFEFKQFRPYQEDALLFISTYIDNFTSKKTDKAALIQLPTGSGKSGIITTVSRCFDTGAVIVLTHRSSLRDQLHEDITERFFTVVNQKFKPKIKKKVLRIDESRKLEEKIIESRDVYVMTIQMLSNILSNKEKIFTNLIENTRLIIFDEGHKEPAPTWKTVFRAFKCPKLIFTATPYRNDFQIFDVSQRNIFLKSFQYIKNQNYLRDVKIVPRKKSVLKSDEEFIEDVLIYFDEIVDLVKDPSIKMIIRCDDSSSIRRLSNILENKGRTVIGIHDTFKETDGWERRHVPKSGEENASIWIHQFKLLEGIDDHHFRILALKGKINDAKSLVQQIGRLIRNPSRDSKSIAYVLDHWSDHHKELWDSFLGYDQAIDKYKTDVFRYPTFEEYLEELIKYQPKISYLEGRFRSQFDFSTIKPENDIQIPLKVNLHEKLENFKLSKLIKKIEEEYRKDRVVESYPLKKYKAHLILSIKFKNSFFLRNHSYLETDLHITIIKETEDIVCIFDSTVGSFHSFDKKIGLGYRISPSKMKNLFQPGEGAKINSVSLINSNLSQNSIRSRTINANSIGDTIPGLSDYAHICTTAYGYSKNQKEEKERRYVGLSRGTVVQSTTEYRKLSDYFNWLQEITKTIKDDTRSLQIFNRYASESIKPTNPKPRNILLDVSAVQDNYRFVRDKSLLVFEDLCLEVNNNEFILSVNNNKASILIEYNKKTGRYKLVSPQLDELCTPIESKEITKPSIIKELNSKQHFRILPTDTSKIYVNGQFYEPTIAVGKNFDPDYSLGNCFFTDDIIGTCTEEKGKSDYYTENITNWYPESLFGIISRLGEQTNVENEFGKPDFFICDDMSAEIADFILVQESENPKVVFVHAKSSKKITQSAKICKTSEMHDACSQAIKNLGYLTPFTKEEPQKLKSWGKYWNKTKVERVHFFDDSVPIEDGRVTWDRTKKVLDNPLADKEVWLFLGNIISKSHFEEKLSEEKPPPHILQALYLLQDVMVVSASIGAKLKIFCSE